MWKELGRKGRSMPALVFSKSPKLHPLLHLLGWGGEQEFVLDELGFIQF